MDERRWWATRVKPKWHQPLKHWVAWKVQDHAFKGLPDALVNARGSIAMIECKYEKEVPKDHHRVLFAEPPIKAGGKGLTVEQRGHLQEWQDAGGWAFGFFGVGRQAYLISLEVIDPNGMSMAVMHEAAAVFCDGYEAFNEVMKFIANLRDKHA